MSILSMFVTFFPYIPSKYCGSPNAQCPRMSLYSCFTPSKTWQPKTKWRRMPQGFGQNREVIYGDPFLKPFPCRAFKNLSTVFIAFSPPMPAAMQCCPSPVLSVIEPISTRERHEQSVKHGWDSSTWSTEGSVENACRLPFLSRGMCWFCWFLLIS